MLGEVQTSVSCISGMVPSTRVEDGQEDGVIDMNVQSNQTRDSVMIESNSINPINKFGFVNYLVCSINSLVHPLPST